MTTKKHPKDTSSAADQASEGASHFIVTEFVSRESDTFVCKGLSSSPLWQGHFDELQPKLSTLFLTSASANLTEIAQALSSPVLPDEVDEETIERLVKEAEDGIPEEKLQRRGRPTIGADAASTYSVRLPDDLVKLVDEKASMEDRTRSELIREALIDYLTR